MSEWGAHVRVSNAVLWALALLLSLPFLVAVYRKLKSLSLLLAEISVTPVLAGRFTDRIRRLIAELVPLFAMFGIFLLLVALSGRILPPMEWLAAVLASAAVLLGITWRWFIRIHATLQIALRETIDRDSA